MRIAQTERTHIDRITLNDAPFFLELLNSEPWKKYIGDRGVRDRAAAESYIRDRLLKTYDDHGFGYYLVRRPDGAGIGTCGFLKKPHLNKPDFGFAFLPQFHGRGYARESAAAILEFGVKEFKFTELVAETLPQNHASIGLLKALDFQQAHGTVTPVTGRNTILFRWRAES